MIVLAIPFGLQHRPRAGSLVTLALLALIGLAWPRCRTRPALLLKSEDAFAPLVQSLVDAAPPAVRDPAPDGARAGLAPVPEQRSTR